MKQKCVKRRSYAIEKRQISLTLTSRSEQGVWKFCMQKTEVSSK